MVYRVRKINRNPIQLLNYCEFFYAFFTGAMIVKGCMIFERTLLSRKKSHNLAWSCAINNIFYCETTEEIAKINCQTSEICRWCDIAEGGIYLHLHRRPKQSLANSAWFWPSTISTQLEHSRPGQVYKYIFKILKNRSLLRAKKM